MAQSVSSSSTREKLLGSAMALFGAKGYRATTVGEIEHGAGLSPRAGAFYRHFESKAAVFHAVLDRWIAEVQAFSAEFAGLLPLDDLRSELTVIARGTLRLLTHQQDLFRLLARDADDFPVLVERVHHELVERGYDELEAWFRSRLERHGLPTGDSMALAAVALSALVHYKEDQAVYGSPPGRVEEDDYVRTWVNLVERWFR